MELSVTATLFSALMTHKIVRRDGHPVRGGEGLKRSIQNEGKDVGTRWMEVATESIYC